MRGGAVIAHKARLPIACGGRGGREHPPLPYIQPSACRFLFLLFSYLRFAEAASFDKKELRRSYTIMMQIVNRFTCLIFYIIKHFQRVLCSPVPVPGLLHLLEPG